MAKSIPAASVKKIIITCEAGMGSSLMAANKLKRLLKQKGIQGIEVANWPARVIPADTQIVLCHEGLYKLASERAPWAVCFSFKDFFNIPAFDIIVDALINGTDIVAETNE